MAVVTVVVPTHNRARYAKSCIQAILAIADQDIELVMTDTSTDGELQRWLNHERPDLLEDPRFVYRVIKGPSDVTKNHNDAFALATGDYMGVVGDDDCITSALPEAMRWAAAHDVPAVTQTLTATYAWPDFRSKLARGGHAGRLYVPRRPGRWRWRDAEADLRACLNRGFQGTDQMPRTYHGFVRRDLLQTMYDRTGLYVHGSSPDMSGSVAVAAQISRYCEIDLPLTIPGISGGSNSGRSALNTHKGDLSSDNQTSKFVDRGWPLGIPRFFSVETVWAHAGLETLRLIRPSLLTNYNYAHLLALCELRHPDYLREIRVAQAEADSVSGRSLGDDIVRETRALKWARIQYLARRALNPSAANGRRYFRAIENVARASDCYEEYARQARFDVNWVLSA